MYWCHSCSKNCSCSDCCSICHSQAIEEVTSSSNPTHFDPYLIQQKQEEPLYSLDSLYRTVYRDLFEAARERIPQQVRRVNENGNLQVSYVFVLNASEEEHVRGLTVSEIQDLQTREVHRECSVCQQVRPAEGFILDCSHEFHRQCLTPWITANGTCPTCRFKLVHQ